MKCPNFNYMECVGCPGDETVKNWCYVERVQQDNNFKFDVKENDINDHCHCFILDTEVGTYCFVVDKENNSNRVFYNGWDFPIFNRDLIENKFREYLDSHGYSNIAITKFDIKDSHYYPDVRLCITYRGEEYNVLIPLHDPNYNIYWASGIIPPQEDRLDVEVIIKNYIRKVYKYR